MKQLKKKRLRFKQGIHKIIVPTIVSFELESAIEKEIVEFFKKFKINKGARLELRYSGGVSYDIVVKK